MLFAIVMNFTAIGLVNLVTRKLEDLINLQFTMAVSGILINTCMILYPSICQAASKEIVNFMWRLLASTCDFEDIRVQQIRTMHLKPLRVLCFNAGMTLRAYGVPVTYGAVIRLFIWSLTLIVVSFDRRQ